MSDQLALDVAPARAYECCGEPCGPIGHDPRAGGFPHAQDCANPNIGKWIDGEGRPLRLLWCSDSARMGGPCPYVGDRARFMPAGGCCKAIGAAAA